MMCYAGLGICLRLCMLQGMAAKPAVIARMVVTGFIGCICMSIVAILTIRDDSDLPHGGIFFWPAINALASAFGLYCGVCSFSLPKAVTAIVSSIFYSSSVVTIMLSYL